MSVKISRLCMALHAASMSPVRQATQLLVEAKKKYEGGDKLAAMKVYEDVMYAEPTTTQRQASLFGVMVR